MLLKAKQFQSCRTRRNVDKQGRSGCRHPRSVEALWAEQAKQRMSRAVSAPCASGSVKCKPIPTEMSTSPARNKPTASQTAFVGRSLACRKGGPREPASPVSLWDSITDATQLLVQTNAFGLQSHLSTYWDAHQLRGVRARGVACFQHLFSAVWSHTPSHGTNSQKPAAHGAKAGVVFLD